MSIQPQQMLSKEIARLKEENDRLRDQVSRCRELIAVLQELEKVTPQVYSNQELLRLLKRILSDALVIVGVQDGSLALLDDETAELEFVIVCGQVAPSLIGYRFPSNEGIAGWVVAHQQPVITHNALLDERFSRRIDQETGFSTRSILAAPLIGDDRVLGVVELINKPEEEPFDELDQALVWLLCRFAGQALSGLDRALPPLE